MKSEKPYKVSVPIPLVPFDERYFEGYVRMLKKMDADRVFLFAPPLKASYIPDLEEFRGWSAILRDKIAFFDGLGYEVAFWMGHTIGHGGELSLGNKPMFQQLVGPEGKEAPGCFCPLDKKLREHMSKALAIMAESGVGLMMLDDDFRVNLHPPEVTAGCFCPLHLAAFREKTGLNLSREEIVDQALCGKPNDMRKQWLEFQGGVLLAFAGEIEQAVHKVNPKARIALATAMTLWSNEGVDMHDLLKRLAGGTQPFLRTIGAPYWSKNPSGTSWVIEYSRLQKHWTSQWDVELMSEGDSFPHTRYHCPAAAVHAYQQGLFAAGFTGILNYALVYAPHPEHEQDYVNKAAESLQNYAALCRFFPENYVSAGVHPVYVPNNMMHIVMPEKPQVELLSWADEPAALRFLGRLGIPVGYEGDGPVFLSGYGAAGLPAQELDKLLAHGAVVDAVAARWLLERGVDIGVSSMADEKTPVFEKYTDPEFSGSYADDTILLLTAGEKMYTRCETVKGVDAGAPAARIISEFSGIEENSAAAESFPAVILYENAKQQRFCVLAFDIYSARNGRQLLYNYARQEQLTRCLAWVNRKALPVTVNATPDVHVMCRVSADAKRIAIAVQNCNLDPIKNPVLRLNPRIVVGNKIELLLPDADVECSTTDFSYKNDGTYGYLTLNATIPPMGLLGVGLVVM